MDYQIAEVVTNLKKKLLGNTLLTLNFKYQLLGNTPSMLNSHFIPNTEPAKAPPIDALT